MTPPPPPDPAATGEPDLAVFGRAPRFATPLHVGRPNLGDRATFRRLTEEALDRLWLTNNGPLVRAFETAVADRVGAKHCIAVANATLGLLLALKALGVRGEVIVPSFTFIATANVVSWLGLTPRFADIDPATGCLDPAHVERLVNENTGAILGVHLWGTVCDVDALGEIAARHGIPLLFDAAQAFGVTLGERHVGTFGDAEVFSFHATKVLNTFEGGAILTDDDRLANTLTKMRNFGFVGADTVAIAGLNAKMSEPCAAMGLASLPQLADVIAANRAMDARFRAALADIPGLRLVASPAGSNFHYLVAEVDAAQFGLSRDALLYALHTEGVFARRYYYPGCHRTAPFLSADTDPLPVTEAMGRRILQLPTGTSVTAEEVVEIGRLIRLCHVHAADIAARLKTARPLNFPYQSLAFYEAAMAQEGGRRPG